MKKTFLILCFLLLCGTFIQAQRVLKATPKNAFINPDAGTGLLNILSNDELGSCGAANILIHLLDENGNTITQTERGTISVEYVDGYPDVRYTLNHLDRDYIGQDRFYYQLQCYDNYSNHALILININDIPDNLEVDGCFIAPTPMEFAIRQAVKGDTLISNITPLLVGNIDDDDEVEIIAFHEVYLIEPLPVNADNYYGSMGFSVFNYQNGRILHKNKFYFYDDPNGSPPRSYDLDNITAMSGVGAGAITKYKYRDHHHQERTQSVLLVCCGHRDYFSKLHAYDPTNGQLLWVTEDEVPTDPFESYRPVTVTIRLADFNKDGIPEVYRGASVYDIQTGDLLCQIDDLIERNHAVNEKHQSFSFLVSPMSTAVDIDGDGTWGLAVGPKLYRIDPDPSQPSDTPWGVSEAADWSLANDAFEDYGLPLPDPEGPYADSRKDLFTMQVDVDNDNQSEIVGVYAFQLDSELYQFVNYVWKPQADYNSFILGFYSFKLYDLDAMGMPLIGNIDDDPYPELIFITGKNVPTSGHGHDPNYMMYALKYDPYAEGLNNIYVKWAITHTDISGQTGITLFDFNKDDKSELVYRSMNRLRIIDGSSTTPENLTTFENIKSATLREFPIVADIDDDGEAEIIVAGDNTNSPINGYIHIFKSGSAQSWAAARPVWNEYCYNPTWTNNDLTIPQSPLVPSTVFVGPKGNMHRPFNNFMQQASLLDDHGKLFEYGPDLTFDTEHGVNRLGTNAGGTGVIFDFDPLTPPADIEDNTTLKDLTVTAYISNEGDAEFEFPLTITAYEILNSSISKNNALVINSPNDATITYYTDGVAGNPQSISVSITGGTTDGLPQGETLVLEYTFPVYISHPNSDIELRLNESETGAMPANAAECRYYNNYSGLYYALSYVACEGDEIHLEMYPPTAYTYKWYTVPKGEEETTPGYPQTGSSIDAIKNNELKQVFYVDVYEGSPDTDPEADHVNHCGRYPVIVYLAPSELVWTGLDSDQDWHNPRNWVDPIQGDILNDEPAQFRIPTKCTNVLIPDGLFNYPDLSKADLIINEKIECADIRFEFGGEVARTDLLDYDRAFIQYNFGYYESTNVNSYTQDKGYVDVKPNNYQPSYLKRGRYYAMAAPLKRIVTGDFSVGGYPAVWQMKYEGEEIQDEGHFAGFTKTYNALNYFLDENESYAVALWIGDANKNSRGEGFHVDGVNYQTGLNNLNGIIELPFFEDLPATPGDTFYRTHTYNNSNRIYYYFQDRAGFPISNRYDLIDRGKVNGERYDFEANRFVFDGNISANKEYFTITVPTGRHIMIGNPTLSTMNFDAFWFANREKIENYYRVFNSETFETNSYFTDYPKQTGGTLAIAPLQAFFIKTKGDVGGTVDLVYPFKEASITRTKETSHVLRSACRDEACLVSISSIMQIEAEYEGNSSSITLVLDNAEEKNIDQMFYFYATKTPQIYLVDNDGIRNAVQFEKEGTQTIPLGICNMMRMDKSSGYSLEVYDGLKGNISLKFKNAKNLFAESLVLLDTKTGTETDLKKDSIYSFQHEPTAPFEDRFLLKIGVPSGGTYIEKNINPKTSVKVYRDKQELTVVADQPISSLEVYTLQGQLVEKQVAVNKPIAKLRNNVPGIRLIRVTLDNGERVTVKTN